MKLILLAATLIFVAFPNLRATEALIFDGGGYNIYILIGMAERPVVAQVRFTAPGANLASQPGLWRWNSQAKALGYYLQPSLLIPAWQAVSCSLAFGPH
jgi:hypothetical protein